MMVPFLLMVIALARAQEEVCCPGFDECFQSGGAFGNLPLPECTESAGITHDLYTRSNRNIGQTISRDTIPGVWSASKETIFLIHGWNSNKDSQWMNDAKNAILDKDDKNVVITGWGPGANRANYAQSASTTRVVGAETRAVVENLRSAGGSQFYCVGHSLGGHSCGHTGQYGSDRGVNRITGLDPAGPLFQDADERRGLNPNCANQVEAWHTDGKDSVNSYGTLRPMGQRDYYPNGGGVQPGCNNYALGFSNEAENPDLRDDPLIACSHSRAPKYFVQSVQNDCFRVSQSCSDEQNMPGSCSSCSNCANMGYVNGSGPNGLFYLEVNPATPHCQG